MMRQLANNPFHPPVCSDDGAEWCIKTLNMTSKEVKVKETKINIHTKKPQRES